MGAAGASRAGRTAAAVLAALGLWLGGGAHAGEGPGAPARVSRHVEGADGTRLAADVWLPAQAAARRDLPVIIEFTRYWRSGPGDEVPAMARHFVEAGYAFMTVDARGTGASFGARTTEFAPEEVRDMGAVIAWAARQPWSNGRVATLGTSYAGNTAELAAIPRRPELRAVVPRFSDFSAYRHAVRPGGARNRVIADAWIAYTRALDSDRLCAVTATPCDADQAPRVRGVDEDADGALRAAALADHARNTDLTGPVAALVYADDPFGTDGEGRSVTLDGVSPQALWRDIDAADVPAFHWASWFDGGTAEGVLTRFVNYASPMRVIIGPWTHGGGYQAVTDGAGAPPPEARPSPAAQRAMIQAFLDPVMKADPPAAPPGLGEIRYYTLGREAWSTTRTWPPAHVRPTVFYLGAGGELSTQAPASVRAWDTHVADPTATTGPTNRWTTQLGAPVIYDDRRDARVLAYATAPLARAVEITGSPAVRIELASSQASGVLFVYLEQVFPDGRVAYLSEGRIDLKFHGPAQPPEGFRALGPTHGFRRADARPIRPGEPISLSFSLHPISVELPAGSRIRLSMAAADADTFDTPAAPGDPLTLTLFRQVGRASSVTLPLAYP